MGHDTHLPYEGNFRFFLPDKVFETYYIEYFEKCSVLNAMINEKNMTMTFHSRMICDVSFSLFHFFCENPRESPWMWLKKQIEKGPKILAVLCLLFCRLLHNISPSQHVLCMSRSFVNRHEYLEIVFTRVLIKQFKIIVHIIFNC